jgi:hypothetical protein
LNNFTEHDVASTVISWSLWNRESNMINNIWMIVACMWWDGGENCLELVVVLLNMVGQYSNLVI